MGRRRCPVADREVEGVNLDELEDQYLAFEVAVVAALNSTMRKALREDAVAGTLARVSLDDLNVIPPLWMQQVPGLAEQVVDAYVTAANMQQLAYEGATGRIGDMWSSEHEAAVDYLASASNRLVGIGDELWADARNELLAGLDLGEDVPTITARVRKTVDVTKARATAIARTEAISASNAGSIAFMRATGQVATKAWLSHLDARTRPEHRAADGQEVDLDAKFTVGGVPMDHPGDPSAPAHLVVQCRCTMRFGLTIDSADLAQDGDTLAASALEDAVTVTEPTDLSVAEVREIFASHDALVAALDAMEGDTVGWEGIICVTDTPTGDRRQFDSLSWADLPLPLRRNIVESHGGVPMTQAVLVGRIDSIQMRGAEVHATGVIDLGSEAGREAARLMGTADNPGFLRGVSIDGDETPGEPATVELVYPDGCADLGPDSTMEDMGRCMEPELSIWSHARIRGATLTDIAALTQANLYLTEDPGAMVVPGDEEYPMAAGGGVAGTKWETVQMTTTNEPTMADVVETLTAAAATIVIPDLPPAWWFDEPTDKPEFGAITITDEGRLYGLLAPGGVAHRGMAKRVEVPTRNVDYTRFMNRERIVENVDGSARRIATGAITMNCGHVSPTGPMARNAAATMEVYDNSCSIFATACIGEDRKGNVWIAGAVMPDVTGAQIARALACQLSGDWRPHRDRQGWRELCGALLVPVPGFPVSNKARVTMQADALVASAVPVRFAGDTAADCNCHSGPTADTANAARAIAASVGRDHATRARDLYLSVKS